MDEYEGLLVETTGGFVEAVLIGGAATIVGVLLGVGLSVWAADHVLRRVMS